MPPSRGNEEFASAEVVGTWAKDFDAEAVFANEKTAVIAHLQPMEEEEGTAAVTTSGRTAFFQLESVGGAKVQWRQSSYLRFDYL
jgi:nuclear GTP-binding protein